MVKSLVAHVEDRVASSARLSQVLDRGGAHIMGRRGPPPKPTKLRVLEGNPGHRRIPENEPKPKGKAACPDWICDPAKELWAQLAPDLEREELLTARSSAEFASYCQERAIYAIYSELLKTLRPRSPKVERYRSIAMKANDRALRLGQKFGITPSDMVGLAVPSAPGKPKSKDEEFLFGRSGSA